MSAPAVVLLVDTLATQINMEHERAFGKAREALEHARHAGELLLQAKAAVTHGHWLPWITANCKFSARQAQRYMVLAENWPTLAAKYDTASHLTLRDAISLTKEDDPLTPEGAAHRCAEIDRQHAAARVELGIAQRILDDPEATIEEIAWCMKTGARLESELHGTQTEVSRDLGLCLNELKALTRLSDSELLPLINDGSLLRAARERLAELGAAA